MAIHDQSPASERANRAANAGKPAQTGQPLNPAMSPEAIERLNASRRAAAAPAPAPAATPAPQAQQAPKHHNYQQATMQQQQPTTLAGFSVFNPPVISSQPAAEALKTFMDAITEVTKAPANIFKITAVPVSRSEFTHLFVSAIVVCVSYAEGNDNSVAYHAMLISDTAGTLPTNTANINGRQYEVLQVVGDAYDETYKQAVATAVARTFPNVNPSNLLMAEAQVIPYGYDFKNTGLVRQTLANALAACGTVLNTNSAGNVEFALPQNASTINTTARLQFNQNQRADAVGEPRRTDVVIQYCEVSQTQQQQGGYGQPRQPQTLNTGEQTVPLFEIGGFMDLLWDPEPSAGVQNVYIPQQQNGPAQATQLYSPRFVITELNAAVLRTLPAQLLGIATVLTLSDNNNWVGAFQRQPGSGARLHDIGAVGYEAPQFRDRIDTSSDAFRPENFNMLMQAYVRPRLTVSFDVAEWGPDTWLNSILLAAALGSVDANNTIIEAADTLTNGNFRSLYGGNQPVLIDDDTRVHTGWYLRDGVRCDIRDADYLAVLNQTFHKNPRMIRDWSDMMQTTRFPQEQRLATRKVIIEETLASSEIHFTGFARRVSFTSHFLDCLARAVIATGLQIRPITPFQDMSDQPRATASYLDQTRLGATGNSGLFNRPYGQAQQSYGAGGARTFGRWGQ